MRRAIFDMRQMRVFYLAEPNIENLSIEGLPKKYSALAARFIKSAVIKFYATRPVYRLKSNDTKQAAAKLLLKDVVVDERSIRATLGL